MPNILIDTYKKEGLRFAIIMLNRRKDVPQSDIIEFIDFLAEKGDLNKRVQNKGIPHLCIEEDVLKAFVKAGGDINLKENRKGALTPLGEYITRIMSSFDTIKENIVDSDNFYNMVKLFFELGADPNDIGTNKITANFSIDKRIPFIVKILLNQEWAAKIEDSCGKAGKDKFIRILASLIDLSARYKADMNVQDIMGKTPLFFAHFPELISTLLRNGADPNPSSRDLLSETIGDLKYDKTKLLLEAGAKIKQVKEINDTKYSTPLFILLNSASHRHIAPSREILEEEIQRIKDLTKLLIEYGADTEFTLRSSEETVFSLGCRRRRRLDENFKGDWGVSKKLDAFLLTLAEEGANIYVPYKEDASQEERPAISTLPENLRNAIEKRLAYIETINQLEEQNTDIDLYER